MLVTLTFVALLTATISAIVGMGGGILLLAVMAGFMPLGEAVQLHATVQLVSNGTRIAAFFRSVDGRTVRRFVCGALPGVVIGFLILRWIRNLDSTGEGLEHAEPYLKIIIGGYILIVTHLPKPRKEAHRPWRFDFTLLGLLVGILGLVVGAIGPIIAPLFARRGFVKENLIATKAVCQMSTHAMKIPAFWALGLLEPVAFSQLFVGMAAMAVAGTFLGKRILRHVSPEAFVMLYKIALTVAGLKVLAYDGLWSLFGSHV